MEPALKHCIALLLIISYVDSVHWINSTSDGRQFLFTNEKKSWTEAKEFCEEHNTTLVELPHKSGSQMKEYLINLPGEVSLPHEFWLGGQNPTRKSEKKWGQWSWLSNEPIQEDAWALNEPNNARDYLYFHETKAYKNTTYCILFNKGENGLWDHKCADEKHFLCEKTCKPKKSCSNKGGSCNFSAVSCNGTILPNGCEGNDCHCCIPPGSYTGAIIGSIGAILLILVLIFIVIIFLKKRKSKDQQEQSLANLSPQQSGHGMGSRHDSENSLYGVVMEKSEAQVPNRGSQYVSENSLYGATVGRDA
ncbi:unnamed protein product [Meganyctiphanes norvegica]|uniref:C-type lectin domain-containing protein n=1 Tax=Meganyctiphanes norvegica TaxID=48144 RepID=A0AAV2Q841_MEGNR